MGPYLLAFPCIWAHLAIQLAAKNPSSIQRLLLVQAPAWSCHVRWAKYIDQPRFLTRPVVGQAVMGFVPLRVGRLWYKVSLKKGQYHALMPTLQNALDQGGFCCLASLWQAWFGHGALAPPLAIAHQPTLVAWGLADRTHAKSHKQSLAHCLSNVEWYQFQDAGHCPELEAPHEYAALLARWIYGNAPEGFEMAS
jgi:pimeloyl-ACP methyl ester carboxylesterase